MTNPVDLTNLRSMIDNDVELEKELTAEFFSGADVCIDYLSRSLDAGQQAIWHQHAHALKGMALGFGAESLGHLATDAQEKSNAAIGEKENLLQQIKAEYAAVKEFMQAS